LRPPEIEYNRLITIQEDIIPVKSPLIRAFLPFALCISSIPAQSRPAQKPLSNDDIIEMSRAGVPQSTIITDIQSTPVKFDVSPAGIVALHAGGVSEAVLNQMIRAGTRQKFPASFGVATATFPVGTRLARPFITAAGSGPRTC